MSIFHNADLLTDIHEVSKPLYLEADGGRYQVLCHMGAVQNLGKVWFNPESIANILLLAQVRRVHCITMDSAKQPVIHVHKPDGSGSTVFSEHKSGLCLHDVSVQPGNVTSPLIVAYSCLQTVVENKKAFMKCQIEAADEA